MQKLLRRECIAVMQPTESWQGDNLAVPRMHGGWNSPSRSVFAKSEVSTVLVVIADVLRQQPPQVSPVQHNHVIQELPTQTANPTLGYAKIKKSGGCSPHSQACRSCSPTHSALGLRVTW